MVRCLSNVVNAETRSSCCASQWTASVTRERTFGNKTQHQINDCRAMGLHKDRDNRSCAGAQSQCASTCDAPDCRRAWCCVSAACRMDFSSGSKSADASRDSALAGRACHIPGRCVLGVLAPGKPYPTLSCIVRGSDLGSQTPAVLLVSLLVAKGWSACPLGKGSMLYNMCQLRGAEPMGYAADKDATVA